MGGSTSGGSGGGMMGPGGSGGRAGTGGVGSAGAATGGSGSGGAATGGRTGTGGAGSGGSGSGGALGSGGAATGGSGTGGRGTGGAASGGSGSGGTNATVDGAQYNFEGATQSWTNADNTPPFTTITHTSARHFAGAESLGASIGARAGATYILEVRPPTPAILPGATVTFHVYVPAGAAIGSLQPYVLDDQFVFTGTFTNGFAQDAWTTLNVVVPAGASPIIRLGVQIEVTAAWTGTVNIDSVSW